MAAESEFVIVSTTVGGEDAARELAGSLVQEKLAACVHRVPVQSTYRWKGEVENDQEVVLAAKTRAPLAGALIDFIKARHPYELPEIVVTPIIGGYPPYLDWIREQTG